MNKAKVFIGENRCQHRAGVRRDDRKGQAQAWQACCADTPNPCFPVGVLSEPFTTCSILLAYAIRSEEHTSELQSIMRISYAVFCLKKKKKPHKKAMINL